MTFCQIVLNSDLIKSIPENPYDLDWWAEKVNKHVKQFPQDPIPIPFRYFRNHLSGVRLLKVFSAIQSLK